MKPLKKLNHEKILLLIIIILSANLNAQEKITITGTLIDTSHPCDAENCYYNCSDSIQVTIDEITYETYRGITRKRINNWIEGIGSIKGLLNSGIQLDGGERKLLCVHENAQQIYGNDTLHRGLHWVTYLFVHHIPLSDTLLFPGFRAPGCWLLCYIRCSTRPGS